MSILIEYTIAMKAGPQICLIFAPNVTIRCAIDQGYMLSPRSCSTENDVHVETVDAVRLICTTSEELLAG